MSSFLGVGKILNLLKTTTSSATAGVLRDERVGKMTVGEQELAAPAVEHVVDAKKGLENQAEAAERDEAVQVARPVDELGEEKRPADVEKENPLQIELESELLATVSPSEEALSGMLAAIKLDDRSTEEPSPAVSVHNASDVSADEFSDAKSDFEPGKEVSANTTGTEYFAALGDEQNETSRPPSSQLIAGGATFLPDSSNLIDFDVSSLLKTPLAEPESRRSASFSPAVKTPIAVLQPNFASKTAADDDEEEEAEDEEEEEAEDDEQESLNTSARLLEDIVDQVSSEAGDAFAAQEQEQPSFVGHHVVRQSEDAPIQQLCGLGGRSYAEVDWDSFEGAFPAEEEVEKEQKCFDGSFPVVKEVEQERKLENLVANTSPNIMSGQQQKPKNGGATITKKSATTAVVAPLTKTSNSSNKSTTGSLRESAAKKPAMESSLITDAEQGMAISLSGGQHFEEAGGDEGDVASRFQETEQGRESLYVDQPIVGDETLDAASDAQRPSELKQTAAATNTSAAASTKSYKNGPCKNRTFTKRELSAVRTPSPQGERPTTKSGTIVKSKPAFDQKLLMEQSASAELSPAKACVDVSTEDEVFGAREGDDERASQCSVDLLADISLDEFLHDLVQTGKKPTSTSVSDTLMSQQSAVDQVVQKMKLQCQALLMSKEREWTNRLQLAEERCERLEEEISGHRKVTEANEKKVVELNALVAEYDKTIKEMMGTSHSSKGIDVEKLIQERDQFQEDVLSVEKSFSDLHKRHEKLRASTEQFRANEQLLNKTIDDYHQRLTKAEERFNKLRSQAENRLQQANDEVSRLEKAREQDTIALRAQLKKRDLQVDTLQKTVDQKQRELEEITKICDELIANARVVDS